MPSKRLPASVASKGGEFARNPIIRAKLPVPTTCMRHAYLQSSNAIQSNALLLVQELLARHCENIAV